MKISNFFLIPFILFSCSGPAQQIEKNEPGQTKSEITNGVVSLIPENEWIKSEDPNVIIFPIAFIWEYTTEWLEEDEYGREGELWAYYHPDLKYWLFTRDTYGVSAEMFDWMLVKPDGTALLRSSDEFGKSETEEIKLDFNQDKSIFEVYKPNSKTKTYNQNDLGFPPIEGKGYSVTYEKTNDKSEYFMAETDIDFAPLHNFRLLNDHTEAYIHVPFSSEIPDNYLLLESQLDTPYGRLASKLKSISQTYYEINLKN